MEPAVVIVGSGIEDLDTGTLVGTIQFFCVASKSILNG
jgi:hypothetical protein